MEGDTAGLDLRPLLDAVEAAPPIEAVDVLAAELGRILQASQVSLLIANFSGDALVRMSHVTAAADLEDGHNERGESVPLRGSVHERVLFGQELDIAGDGDGWKLLLPVTERGDAIGVLELHLPEHPGKDVIRYLESAAHALAYVLVVSRRHTDVFEWSQRDVPFSLAAEIQRRLLPSAYTIEGGAFTLAGWLEPAADVGGDTFDYSVDREYLYASVTDAMGHSDEAALLATLAVGSLRNSRRALAAPTQQADFVNAALRRAARSDQFVSGVLARVLLADGSLELVNAGHPLPYLLRGGVAAVIDIKPHPPFGVADAPYRSLHFQLEVGDRLLFVTDGFLERNAVNLDIQLTLERTLERHPREIVRELASNVLKVTDGNLRDDATVLCLDWYGAEGHRDSHAGASRGRATST